MALATRTRTVYAPPLHPGQAAVAASPARFRVLAAGRRWGKALALDTPLPTPTGWTTMGEVQPGDVLYDERGAPCRVLFASEVQLGRPCFAVQFSDGTRIIADAEHQWLTWDRAARVAARRAAMPQTLPAVRTTRAIQETLRAARGREVNHSVAVTEPLACPAADLPIDPYVLGVWLGDGSSAGADITTADPEVLEEIRAAGYGVGAARRAGGRSRTYRLTGRAGAARDGTTGRYVSVAGNLNSDLRALRLLHAKHIPPAYLRASVAQRGALLAGLLDTDGSVQTGGHVEFLVTNQRLAADTFELVATLGFKPTWAEGRATLVGRDIGPRYRVSFTPPSVVFRLPRKRRRQESRHTDWPNVDRRYIVAVEPVPTVPVRCISVDSPSHLFLASRAFIPTHNTRLGAALCVQCAVGGGVAWWVAPTYKVARVGWRTLKLLGLQIPGVEKNDTERILTFPGGGWLQVRSADDPDSLRGDGLDLVVMDECAYTDERAWTEGLRPALSDRQGRALFISTPRAGNWFYRLWQRGAGHDPAYQAWRFHSSDNPYLPAAEIAAARRDLTVRVFRQEFEADFVGDPEGAPFQREDVLHGEAPALARVVVAIDPAGGGPGGDACGIVAAGVGLDGRGYVLADRTAHLGPDAWARRAVALYDELSADVVVAEANFGGELVRSVLRTVRPTLPVVLVHASRGKLVRAEPVAALYAQHRITHCGPLLELEDELCTWLPGSGQSPNRMDAAVWALTHLFLAPVKPRLRAL